MLQAATQYTDVRAAQQRRPARSAQASGIFVPTVSARRVMLKDWYWREMKEGGWLHSYLQREKARNPDTIRRVARLMHGFQQNNQSSFRRLATIPAKLYHRWKAEDEQFFDDDNNLRSLKRDNPDLPVYVGPRQLPTTRLRKTYAKRDEGVATTS